MNPGYCLATMERINRAGHLEIENAGAVLGSGAGARVFMRSFHPPLPNQAALNQVFKILILI